MSSILDYNEQCFEYGYFHKTKTLDCFGKIKPALMYEVIRKLHVADEHSAQVSMHLSSGGGCVDSGFGIYDAMRSMKNSVRVIGYANIESIATLILQGADEGKRCLAPSSFLMLHEGEITLSGSEKDLKEQKRLADYYNEKYYSILHAKVRKVKRISMKRFKEKVEDRDWHLTAEEALSWGLADEIVETY